MKPKSLIMAGAIVASIALFAEGASAAPAKSCFQMSQLQSTKPDGDQRIYARVGLHDVYRLDLAFRCSALLSKEGIVLIPAGGQNLICTPLDLDLRARELGGVSTPCNIKSISKLTPEEAAALPPKVRP